MRQEDSVGAFLKKLGQYKVLKPEEELNYARLAKNNKIAKNKLVNHNLRLVVSIAKNYQNRGMEIADLIQEGTVGLMQAIDKFDRVIPRRD